MATANSGLSIRNYAKSAAAARALGVDPQLARLVLDTARNISSVGTCPVNVDFFLFVLIEIEVFYICRCKVIAGVAA